MLKVTSEKHNIRAEKTKNARERILSTPTSTDPFNIKWKLIVELPKSFR